MKETAMQQTNPHEPATQPTPRKRYLKCYRISFSEWTHYTIEFRAPSANEAMAMARLEYAQNGLDSFCEQESEAKDWSCLALAEGAEG